MFGGQANIFIYLQYALCAIVSKIFHIKAWVRENSVNCNVTEDVAADVKKFVGKYSNSFDCA